MNNIAVLIVVFNGERWLNRCLRSLSVEEKLDIYIFDNHSTDNSIKIIQSYEDVSFFYKSSKNIGFGQANNYLMYEMLERNQYKHCLLLNQDAWILPNTMVSFNTLLPSFSEYSVISPLHLSRDTKNIDDDLEEYLIDGELKIILDLFPETEHLLDIYDIDFVNAAAWFIKVEDLKKIGGFDPLFFYTGEDMDFAFRLKHHGFKMGVSPKICIVHDKYQREPILPNNNFKYRASHKADLLIRIKDIRKSSFDAYFSAFKFLIKHLGISIVKTQLWRFRYNCKLLIFLILNIHLFSEHRSKSKSTFGAFLNIKQ